MISIILYAVLSIGITLFAIVLLGCVLFVDKDSFKQPCPHCGKSLPRFFQGECGECSGEVRSKK